MFNRLKIIGKREIKKIGRELEGLEQLAFVGTYYNYVMANFQHGGKVLVIKRVSRVCLVGNQHRRTVLEYNWRNPTGSIHHSVKLRGDRSNIFRNFDSGHVRGDR